MRIKPKFNNLLIKPHLKRDETTLKSGIKLHLDTTIDVEKLLPTFGEVVDLPTKMYFQRGNPHSLEFDVDVEVEIGDTVFFHYLMAENIKGRGRTYKDENGDVLWLVPYDQVFFAVRNGRIVPTNGYILVEPLEGDKEKSSILEMPDMVKGKKSEKFARVIHAGDHVETYRTTHNIEFDGEINEGDIIMYSAHSDAPIQWDVYNDVCSDKDLRRMQRKDVIAVFTEEQFNKVKFD